MNKVILMGRLTKEPEIRQTQQGVSVCSFSIAVNRRFAKEGQQDADFINCIAWRNTAEFIAKYFRKGNMISVVGSIQTRTWENENRKKQYATEVIIDEAYFTGSKESTSPSDMPSGFEGFTQADEIDGNLPF